LIKTSTQFWLVQPEQQLALVNQNIVGSRSQSVTSNFFGTTVTCIQDCQGEWLLTQCNRLCSSWLFRDCKAAKKPCQAQREFSTSCSVHRNGSGSNLSAVCSWLLLPSLWLRQTWCKM